MTDTVTVIQTKELKQIIREIIKEKPEKLFTISEVAEKLGLSYKQVWRRARQERIKTTLCGKFISQQAINNYLNLKNQ